MIIKLRDKIFAHDNLFLKNTENITYSRDNIYDNDIVIYTIYNLNEYYNNASKNIVLFLESPEIENRGYNYILNNIHKYDLILTFSKKLLDLNNHKIKLNLYGTTWLHENYRKIYEKTKLCSTITSRKKVYKGHFMRHIICDIIESNNMRVDLYGGRYNNLQQSTEPNPKSLSNGKINSLKDHMFSITIENCKEDYYFTEKLIDCFLSGTVPIYWGCPSIGKFFNIKGIIMFDNVNECINIIDNLSQEKYNEMLPYIKENFETAKKYADFKIDERYLLDKHYDTDIIYFDKSFLENYWEVDWIKELFFINNLTKYIYYQSYKINKNKIILIINIHVLNEVVYFINNILKHKKFFILSISDENLKIPKIFYSYNNCLHNFISYVIPNTNLTNTTYLPLGYKQKMFQDKSSFEVQKNSKRKFVWSFCGQVTKSNRMNILNSIKNFKPYYIHQTSAFGSSDALQIVNYRNILEDTYIVPCLTGFVSIDTFRLYEALECGCIPIVLKYNINFNKTENYYERLFGDHPLPVIENFAQLNNKIIEILENDYEKKRIEIYTWYNNFKNSLKLQIKDIISN